MTPPPPPSTTSAPAEPADVCTIDDVAAWLGVDRKTVYQAARRRQIPCARLGRRFLLSRAAIRAWLGGTPP